MGHLLYAQHVIRSLPCAASSSDFARPFCKVLTPDEARHTRCELAYVSIYPAILTPLCL